MFEITSIITDIVTANYFSHISSIFVNYVSIRTMKPSTLFNTSLKYIWSVCISWVYEINAFWCPVKHRYWTLNTRRISLQTHLHPRYPWSISTSASISHAWMTNVKYTLVHFNIWIPENNPPCHSLERMTSICIDQHTL